MKYQPNPYIAQIQMRKDRYKPFYDFEGPLFDTWEEAQQWIVADRTKKLERAKKELQAAERALKRAVELKEKHNG